MTRARVAMKRRIYHFDERYSLAGRVSDGTLIDNRLICSALAELQKSMDLKIPQYYLAATTPKTIGIVNKQSEP